MDVLSDEQLEGELARLPGWRATPEGLAAVYRLPSAAAALRFIAAVGEVAEELGHHPDLDWRYNRVVLRFATHDAGGKITTLDAAAAHRCLVHAETLDATAQPERLPGAGGAGG
ncbi:4a-hydroxytetrahydrobiopterin dehydratase [Sinomonas halotolerans]|uniref:Putative pterin-4-alpha-carbinolamine dehydratase n=1 Tax=Sinomonas halotolerans TaxID=1644133 RepID=A0ABU9WW99_9MICC